MANVSLAVPLTTRCVIWACNPEETGEPVVERFTDSCSLPLLMTKRTGRDGRQDRVCAGWTFFIRNKKTNRRKRFIRAGFNCEGTTRRRRWPRAMSAGGISWPAGGLRRHRDQIAARSGRENFSLARRLPSFGDRRRYDAERNADCARLTTNRRGRGLSDPRLVRARRQSDEGLWTWSGNPRQDKPDQVRASPPGSTSCVRMRDRMPRKAPAAGGQRRRH